MTERVVLDDLAGKRAFGGEQFLAAVGLLHHLLRSERDGEVGFPFGGAGGLGRAGTGREQTGQREAGREE